MKIILDDLKVKYYTPMKMFSFVHWKGSKEIPQSTKIILLSTDSENMKPECISQANDNSPAVQIQCV